MAQLYEEKERLKNKVCPIFTFMWRHFERKLFGGSLEWT
ncbi:hypothetical protein PLUTE_b0671 [Pseudoalteromonas luteoviolacea DSM 6061]|nr:hypothetical protein [Pseudoalteromonas luteoviolacea DSM 6061]